MCSSDPAAEPATVLTGYGEMSYNYYSKDTSRNQADLRRFVLGLQHRFDAKAGDVWVFEVNAARAGSPLDSKLEVLDGHGQPAAANRGTIGDYANFNPPRTFGVEFRLAY